MDVESSPPVSPKASAPSREHSSPATTALQQAEAAPPTSPIKAADDALWAEASAAIFKWESSPVPSPVKPARDESAEPASLHQAAPKQVLNHELAAATGGFNPKFCIGAGGFGHVFRASLPSLPRAGTCAIKWVQGANGSEEASAEVEFLTRCRHANVLPLLAYSLRPKTCLVYPLMVGGNLEDRVLLNEGAQLRLQALGHHSMPPPLAWWQRLRILRDVTRGLVYLHTPSDGKPCTLHLDVKPSNVLLDESLNARLADFGLIKRSDADAGGPPAAASLPPPQTHRAARPGAAQPGASSPFTPYVDGRPGSYGQAMLGGWARAEPPARVVAPSPSLGAAMAMDWDRQRREAEHGVPPTPHGTVLTPAPPLPSTANTRISSFGAAMAARAAPPPSGIDAAARAREGSGRYRRVGIRGTAEFLDPLYVQVQMMSRGSSLMNGRERQPPRYVRVQMDDHSSFTTHRSSLITHPRTVNHGDVT